MDALIYILLALTSIVGLAFIVERGLALRWGKVVPPAVTMALAKCRTPANVDALQTAARHEVVRLERGLVVLEIIVGIAPLLGLVGTIAGMITVFGDLGQSGLSDAAKLAQGIALILRATLIGLLIAIPSLIAWSYFSKKVEVLAVEMEALCDDFIRRQYAEPGSGVPGPGSRASDSKSTSTPDAKP